MGWSVFEEICGQWLQRHAKQRLGLTVRQMARYWSRDGRTEIDLIAELDNRTFLFGECRWRTVRVTRLSDLSTLQAKVASLPEARWRNKPSYILFALGGFSSELLQLASDPAEQLYLVSETDILATGAARLISLFNKPSVLDHINPNQQTAVQPVPDEALPVPFAPRQRRLPNARDTADHEERLRFISRPERTLGQGPGSSRFPFRRGYSSRRIPLPPVRSFALCASRFRRLSASRLNAHVEWIRELLSDAEFSC